MNMHAEITTLLKMGPNMLRNSDSAILSGISRPPNTAKPFAVEQIIQTLNAMAQKFSAKGILPGAYSDFAVSTPQGDKPRHPQLSKRRDSRKSFAYSFCDAVLPYILTHPGDIVARPCKTLQDVESAYRLIYKEYLARGYCAENPSQMHYNFYCILPESRTFVVEKSGVIVGTLSAFVDSPSGLPLESLYPAEVAKFRVKGRRLAEVGLLALDSDVFSRRSFSLTDVSKMSA